MKMKKWMALSCAAAMVLSTFPVSADEAVNEDVSGSITVWEHAYSFEEALKAVIEGFKAKYPNVEVDYEIKASDYQQVLATALQSGEGPGSFLDKRYGYGYHARLCEQWHGRGSDGRCGFQYYNG